MTTEQKKNKTSNRKSSHLLPALMAVGSACSLASAPAAALELGEIQINSALGQPLRASIAYALAANEQLSGYCIYLRPARAGTSRDIPAFSQAHISVTDGSILINGSAPVNEPMMSMQVGVDCPYTPHLLREYTLLVDPAVMPSNDEAVRSSVAAAPVRQENVVVAQSNRVTEPRTPRGTVNTVTTPVSMSSEYQVQPGDTVSTIVSRIEGRKLGLWPAVNAIFDANPSAFIDNDVNRLMAGKVLAIPEMIGSAPVVARETTAATSTVIPSDPTTDEVVPTEVVPSADTAAEVFEDVVESGAEATTTPVAPGDVLEGSPDQVVQADQVAPNVVVDAGGIDVTMPTNDQVAGLRPGDVVLPPIQTETIDPIYANTIVEDQTATRIAAPGNGATSGNANNTGAWDWLVWLGGAGVAMILGLLLFGRSMRERFGFGRAGHAEIAGRRADDDPTQKTPIIEDVDIEFEDTINSRAISLDADLEEGTGLHAISQIEVAEDFGFTESAGTESDVDLDVGEEVEAESEDTSTDVIPPQHKADVSTILTEELPGDAADEEYDFSMVVDATKQRMGEYDATAKDLQAVQIDGDTDEDDGGYTLSQEADYQVLEQDYEDELSATQILNAQVERAAAELAEHLAAKEDIEITSEICELEPTQEIYNVEETQEMPARGEAVVLPTVTDPSNTAELTAQLPSTLEAENDETAADLASATTIELNASGHDVTVEMQVESGKIDTKKDR